MMGAAEFACLTDDLVRVEDTPAVYYLILVEEAESVAELRLLIAAARRRGLPAQEMTLILDTGDERRSYLEEVANGCTAVV